MNHTYLLLAVLAGSTVLTRPGQAQSPSADVSVFCDATISTTDCALSETVARKLLEVIVLEHDLHTWPPSVYVTDERDEEGAPLLNAFAHPCGGELDEGLPIDCTAPEGQTAPHVHITKALLDQLIQGREARLGFVMGHEMGHITQGHTTEYAHRWKATSEVSLFAFGRQQEIAADLFGMEYALGAGYDYESMLSAIYRFIELDMSYSSFEGLGVGHPSWEERLSFVNDAQINLWRSMNSFRTGVAFLATEQYPVAASLFRKVIASFPDSYEAHANLGYALLMQYMDQLEPADIQSFGVGQVVVGAFTRRPRSLEPPVRGINTSLWFQATTALNTALRLKPDMAVAKANLGIAYLLQPNGSDSQQARELLASAVQLAQYDPDIDSRTKAAIFINAGVADLAQGLLQDSFDRLSNAEKQINAFANGFRASSDVIVHGELQSALYYNTALILSNVTSADAQNASADYFEAYLKGTSPTSNWWDIAYALYRQVCAGLSRPALSQDDLESEHVTTFRQLGAVILDNGVTITLGESTQVVKDAMAGSNNGSVLESLLIENTNLIQYEYFLAGINVLATQEVLALRLSGILAPSLEVRETGLGTEVYTLSIGMSTANLDSILGQDYEKRVLIDPEKGYRFYRDLGLAVHIRNGNVMELVVTQIPYQQILEVETE